MAGVCGIIHSIALCKLVPRLPARHFRYDPKEAVPIEPKKERRISTDGVKPAAGAAGQGGAPQPPKKKKKRRRSIPGMILRFIGCLLCVGIMLCSVAGVVLAMYIVQVTENDGEVLDLDNQKNAQTTILYDRYGNKYATLTRGEDRVWRELSAMPEDLQHAVVAIEDKDFYNNPLGINIKRTIGAALNELTDNAIYGAQQGASTLEQQLVKNLIGDDASSGIEGYMRKVREIFRAIGLANRYSKETILEAYLNTIPLTGIVCGMEAGAQEYFGKHVEDLTLSECAVLASITKNPTAYNPFTNPENLITRRNHVLYEMFTQGYITEEEYNAARAESITLVESSSQNEVVTRTSQNSYFTDAVYYELMNDLQEKLNMTAEEAQSMIFNGGLRVYTTVDPEVQTAIEEALYDAEEAIPALWHEEPVCLRDYPAETSTWEQVQFDEATGLPLIQSELLDSSQPKDAIGLFPRDEEIILPDNWDDLSMEEHNAFYEAYYEDLWRLAGPWPAGFTVEWQEDAPLYLYPRREDKLDNGATIELQAYVLLSGADRPAGTTVQNTQVYFDKRAALIWENEEYTTPSGLAAVLPRCTSNGKTSPWLNSYAFFEQDGIFYRICITTYDGWGEIEDGGEEARAVLKQVLDSFTPAEQD